MKLADPTRRIVAWRQTFLVLQFILVVGLLGLYFYRSGSRPEATRDLPKAHVLAEGDLSSDVIRPLVGKMLRADVKKGQFITDEMLMGPTPSIRVPQSVAAVVAMKEADVVARNLEVGVSVSVLRQGTVSLTGTIIARDCSPKGCALVVALNSLVAGEILNPQSFASADLQRGPP